MPVQEGVAGAAGHEGHVLIAAARREGERPGASDGAGGAARAAVGDSQGAAQGDVAAGGDGAARR